jgi:hypothetical protein
VGDHKRCVKASALFCGLVLRLGALFFGLLGKKRNPGEMHMRLVVVTREGVCEIASLCSLAAAAAATYLLTVRDLLFPERPGCAHNALLYAPCSSRHKDHPLVMV